MQGSKLRPFWSHMLPKCNLCDSKIYLWAFVRVQIIAVVRPLQFSAKRSRITAQHVPRDRELKQVKLFIRLKSGRSHIAPKNAWKTLGALLSPFFQSARAVALRRRLSLLSNHQLRSPLHLTLRHSEKLRCFYLDAARTRLEKTSASHRDRVASIMSAHTARLLLK